MPFEEKNNLLLDCDAIDPFLIKSPFDILTSDEYESHVDALYSSSPKVFINIKFMYY